MSKLSSDTIKWLNKVRREGTNRRRYDLAKSKPVNLNNIYDDTDSIFIYDYTNNSETVNVVIFMKNGEYIDYFRR